MFGLNTPVRYRIVAQLTVYSPVRHLQWFNRKDEAEDVMTDLLADGYFYVAIKDSFNRLIAEECTYVPEVY